MPRLRFVPYADTVVMNPHAGPGDNPHAGRKLAPAGENNPPTDDPIDVLEGTYEANRYVELCRRNDGLHPFDEYTARKCGVRFVELDRRDDGEWVPKAAIPKTSTPPAKPAEAEKKAS